MLGPIPQISATTTADCHCTGTPAPASVEMNWNTQRKGKDMEFSPEDPLPLLAAARVHSAALWALLSHGKALLPDSPASSARRLSFPSFCSPQLPAASSFCQPHPFSVAKHQGKKNPVPQAGFSVESKMQWKKGIIKLHFPWKDSQDFSHDKTLHFFRLFSADHQISSLWLFSINSHKMEAQQNVECNPRTYVRSKIKLFLTYIISDKWQLEMLGQEGWGAGIIKSRSPWQNFPAISCSVIWAGGLAGPIKSHFNV